MPEAHAARAEHRVGLLQLLDAACRSGEPAGRPAGCGQELVQRRVEQADGDRRPVDRPRRISSKSACCSGAQPLDRRRSRWCSSAARIIAAISGWRSPRNMCSVRHRPIPSAPSSIALAGVLRRCRRWPARRACAARRTTPSTVWNCSDICGSTSGTSSVVICRGVPSIAIRSPACSTSSPTRTSPRGDVDVDGRSRPSTAGRPMPRATSAAWLALPPSLVRMPARGVKAGDVVGLGERAARGSPRGPRRRPRPRRAR